MTDRDVASAADLSQGAAPASGSPAAVSPERDDALREIAERLRASIADETFDIGGESQLKMTSSFGVATATPQDSKETLLARADGALYQAKTSGRNQIVFAAEPEDEPDQVSA